MPAPPLLRLLPVPALLLTTAACGGSDDAAAGSADAAALVAEDATLAWTSTVEEDWSPTDAVAVDDLVVVSTSWSIDEGTRVAAYDADGRVVWTYGGAYGAALLADAGDGDVLVCSDAGTAVIADDGEVVSTGEDDDRCPREPDDEAGIGVDHHDDAYSVDGAELTVDGADGSYSVALQDDDPEIWGVDGGVVTFAEDGGRLRLYR